MEWKYMGARRGQTITIILYINFIETRKIKSCIRKENKQKAPHNGVEEFQIIVIIIINELNSEIKSLNCQSKLKDTTILMLNKRIQTNRN